MMLGSNKPIMRTTDATAHSELIRVASGPECQATFIALGFKTINQLHVRQDRNDSLYASVQNKMLEWGMVLQCLKVMNRLRAKKLNRGYFKELKM